MRNRIVIDHELKIKKFTKIIIWKLSTCYKNMLINITQIQNSESLDCRNQSGIPNFKSHWEGGVRHVKRLDLLNFKFLVQVEQCRSGGEFIFWPKNLRFTNSSIQRGKTFFWPDPKLTSGQMRGRGGIEFVNPTL